MKKGSVVFGICICILAINATSFTSQDEPVGVEQTLDYFRNHAVQFAQSIGDLQRQIDQIRESSPATVDDAKNSLRECRLQFKSIEFFFNYFFRSLSIIYNAPPVVEVEEPFMEYREPTGLQVIASLLYSPDPVLEKSKLREQVSLVYESAKDLNSLLYNLAVRDEQILESIQQELIGIMTMGIVGFDAPELKSGIDETRHVLTAFQTILSPYLSNRGNHADSVRFYLDKAIDLTKRNDDFDSFDRMSFLTLAALPLQHHLALLIRENGWALNTTGVVNYEANNLFSPNAININDWLSVDPRMAALGKRLFFENALSGDRSRNCATCHQPEKYFTDGATKSLAIDGHSTLKRNTPSLLYSSFQYSQFWDARVKSLEEQIEQVITDPAEMNGDREKIIAYLRSCKDYEAEFESVFHLSAKGDTVTIKHVDSTLAAFIKTLSPFNSPFDRYMRGDEAAMTDKQINGFNLFMGKALCGTCHAAPLFNGLTPPLYDRTMLEVVGTTRDTNFTYPALDNDMGRFDTYPIEFYRGAFKVPGLRNVAATAPYMHNGAFADLDKVMEFYNRGGGSGLGVSVAHQTLSSDSLRLSQAEIENIIGFLQSLTDPGAGFR